MTRRAGIFSDERCASGDHDMCIRVARIYEIPPWVICGAEPRPGRIGYWRWMIAMWSRRSRRWLREGGKR